MGRLLLPSPVPYDGPDGDGVDQYDLASFSAGVPATVRRAQRATRARLVQADDVLVSRSMDAPRRAWVVGGQRGRAQVATDDWLVLRANGFDSTYLRHLLVSNDFRLRCEQAVTRRRARTLRATDVEEIGIPALSLGEQQRIGLVLEEVATLRGKRRAVLSKLASLRPSVLHELETEASRSDWPCIRLQDLLVPFDNVRAARTADRGYLVNSQHITENGVYVAQEEVGTPITEDLCTRIVANGDVLVSVEKGHATPIAAVAYPHDDLWVAHEALLQLRFNAARLHPEYACGLLMRAPLSARLASRRSRRGSRVLASTEALAETQIALPPLLLQTRYAETVRAIRSLNDTLSASARRLDDLLSVLRDRAFRGELQVA